MSLPKVCETKNPHPTKPEVENDNNENGTSVGSARLYTSHNRFIRHHSPSIHYHYNPISPHKANMGFGFGDWLVFNNGVWICGKGDRGYAIRCKNGVAECCGMLLVGLLCVERRGGNGPNNHCYQTSPWCGRGFCCINVSPLCCGIEFAVVVGNDSFIDVNIGLNLAMLGV